MSSLLPQRGMLAIGLHCYNVMLCWFINISSISLYTDSNIIIYTQFLVLSFLIKLAGPQKCKHSSRLHLLLTSRLQQYTDSQKVFQEECVTLLHLSCCSHTHDESPCLLLRSAWPRQHLFHFLARGSPSGKTSVGPGVCLDQPELLKHSTQTWPQLCVFKQSQACFFYMTI